LALSDEGLNVEPSASLPVACLHKLCQWGGFDRDRPVVCVLTASGLRWSEQAERAAQRVFEVETIDEFERVLDAP